MPKKIRGQFPGGTIDPHTKGKGFREGWWVLVGAWTRKKRKVIHSDLCNPNWIRFICGKFNMLSSGGSLQREREREMAWYIAQCWRFWWSSSSKSTGNNTVTARTTISSRFGLLLSLSLSVCLEFLMRVTICFVHINYPYNEHILIINKRLKDGKGRLLPDAMQLHCRSDYSYAKLCPFSSLSACPS